jgi:hypothetical protein
MAKRTRVHSRDLQPQLATPRGLLSLARVQRFDWPMQLPVTEINELGRRLHVGTTTDIPTVTVTVEGFDVTHNTIAYMSGATPGTFPVSGVSISALKNVDVIGQIRDASTLGIVNALYVKRGVVSGIDTTFGVKANTTISYTISSNSKKELKQPVFYDSLTPALVSGGATVALTHTPTYLTRTSGYILDAYRTGTDGTTGYLDEGTDFTVTAGNISFIGSNVATSDTIWVTYVSPSTTTLFANLDSVSPAAVMGKYVPTTISLSTIPRVQAVTIKVALAPESIDEMGSLGKQVGYEVGVPSVTGDLTVLKTDNDLLAILEGVSNTTIENNMEFAQTNLPLKIQLRNPANPSQILLTYYIPSITISQESDTDQVNQSMNEVFSWQSTTGEMFIISGAGPY